MHAARQTSKQLEVNYLSLSPGIIMIGQADDNDLQIYGPGISEHHARIVTYFHESYLINTSVEHGVLLNGEPVIKHTIKPGDVISLGNYQIIIQEPAGWYY